MWPTVDPGAIWPLAARLADAWARELPGVLAAAAVFFVARRALARATLDARTFRALMALILGAGLAWVLHLGWVADDAFISFRYARHWVEGHGLVFNPGERVEGYTNFLWIVLLSPFQALGVHLGPASIALTALCYLLVLVLTAALSRREWQRARGLPSAGRCFPLASLLLAANYVFASFGTSGLETLLGTLLVLLALERADRGAALSAGTLGILATMAHPDHAIFYACLGATFAAPAPRWRALARYALPFVVLYLPYFAWRWSHYGDFFPNTYYAKNASGHHFAQGAVYLAVSGLSAGLWAALPAAAYAVLRGPRSTLARFSLLAVPLYLAYVAKIGGDFMLGRLLCPLLPPLYILAELGLRQLFGDERPRARRLAPAALALLCTAVVPLRLMKPREVYANIADERTWYPVASHFPFSIDSAYWHWAHAFNRTFADLSRQPTLAMYSVGIVGYETGLRMVDNAGLNHRGVAHTPTPQRGRPGHEKMISPALLLESRADLSDVPVFPEPYRALGRVNVDGVRFHTVRHDPRLSDELAAAGVEPSPLLAHIERYQPAASPARLACDLWHMSHIYFRHVSDEPRRARLLRELFRAQPEQASYASFLLQPPERRGAGMLRAASLGFDEPDPGASFTGDAFSDGLSDGAVLGQASVGGARGRFINSFREAGGNAATGAYTSRPFRIEGPLITLQIAGGFSPEGEYVELLVGGERRFHATGCDSEILGQRLWVTRGLEGQLAQLRVVDAKRGAWGHIVVDELVQWAPVPAPEVRAAPGAGTRQAGHSGDP